MTSPSVSDSNKLDEILETLVERSLDPYPEMYTQAKAAIVAMMEEVIGEDEELLTPNPLIDNWQGIQRQVGRNQARAEQRQRLKKLTKGG